MDLETIRIIFGIIGIICGLTAIVFQILTLKELDKIKKRRKDKYD